MAGDRKRETQRNDDSEETRLVLVAKEAKIRILEGQVDDPVVGVGG